MSQMRFDCLYTKNKIEFKKYDKYSEYGEIISFYDIISKLIKNDDQGLKPSDCVVNSYIRKRLVKAFNENSNILYALKNLDHQTIDSVKSLINQLYAGDLQFNLIISNGIEIEKELLCKFNNIYFFKND
jgi:hypothetical protein